MPDPSSRTPTTTAPRARRCPEPTPGPLLAGPAQAGRAGPSHPGAGPEAASGQTWPAWGPYGEAGRSLASARRAEPAAPSRGGDEAGRSAPSGPAAITGEPGPIPASRRSRGHYRLSRSFLKRFVRARSPGSRAAPERRRDRPGRRRPLEPSPSISQNADQRSPLGVRPGDNGTGRTSWDQNRPGSDPDAGVRRNHGEAP